MPDHHVQPLAIRKLERDLFQLRRAGAHEAIAKQQVLGRIAAQGELGCQDEPRASRICAARRVDNQARIAGEIADGRVDLGQRHLHGNFV